MREFKSIDDVREWLEPMDYPGFWVAVAPYDLVLQDKDHCDQQIAEGVVSRETVLAALKGMARIELTQKLGLSHRIAAPWLKLVKTH